MRVLQAAGGRVIALTFSPDGAALAAAVEGHGVFLWDLAAAAPPLRLDTVASDRTRDLYFTPDGRAVGWLGKDGWRLYDRTADRRTRHGLDARGQLFRLVAAPGGGRVFTQHNFPASALIGWDQGGGDWERAWEVSTEQLAVDGVTAGPDGRRLTTLTRKTLGPRWWRQPFALELRSAASGRVEAAGAYPYSYACRLAFSPDGGQLVGVHGMTLLVWPVPALGEPLLVRNDSRKHFAAAAYHPSGHYLFAASNDTTVQVFDTAGWGRRARFGWNVGPLRAVAVSPDGLLAAAGGDRGEVVVWDVDV